jgi:hypothetical protein
MKKLLFISIIAFGFAACNQGSTNAPTAKTENKKDSVAADKPKTDPVMMPGDTLYGDAFDYQNAVKLTELLKDPSKLDTTKNYAVSAVVTTVCQKKGCWFRAEDGKGGDIFVKIVSDEDKGEEVGIPKKTPAGGNVVFYGTPKFKEVSVKQQRHYAEDAGKSKKEIEAINKPKKEWRFFATGVVVKG